MEDVITFNDLPRIVAEMNRKLDMLLSIHITEPDEKDSLMTVEDLTRHLPETPAVQTVYRWVCERRIPFEKYGKRLYFRKSTIDEWVANGRRME